MALVFAIGLLAQDSVDPAQIEALVKAAAANPKDVNAHFDLALAYSIAGKDAEAIPEYRKVLELSPDLYEAHINLGQVLLRAKQPAEALPQLQRAHEQKPSEFRPAYYLAETLFDRGQFSEALPIYQAALAIDPKSARAELGLGRTMMRLDRRDDAAPHYRNASALDPELKSYLFELAQAYEEKKELEPAIAIYREFPDVPAAVERVGVLNLRLGQAKDASAALEAVVRSSPTTANRMALAQAYLDQKATPQAEEQLAQVVSSEPQNFDVRMFYGRVLRDDRKITAAAREFQEAARIRPSAPQAWSELAGMLILNEQYPEALAALDKVKELGAENVGHMFFRATTLEHLNRKKEALEYYQRFLETSRTNPDQEFQARQRVRTLERELGKR
jgi:tetratricopeptide (TPR) repeat protein